MANSTLEDEYFGEKLGVIPLQQLSMSEFHKECAKKEELNQNGDNTGLRLYAGAHVAIRHIVDLSYLLENKTIIELGCGVGGMGLIGTQLCDYSSMVLTDGEQKTIDGAKTNAHLICSHCGLTDRLDKIQFSTLSWGDDVAACAVRSSYNKSQPFDVVIGCELMYYRTDVLSLVKTVMALTDGSGLFIHAHLFRRSGQEKDLIDAFAACDWMTWEAPHSSFISKEELQHHPEWYKVRALVSGPRNRLSGADVSRHSRWVEFREEPWEEEEEGANEESLDIFK